MRTDDKVKRLWLPRLMQRRFQSSMWRWLSCLAMLHALRVVETLRDEAGIEDRRTLACALLHDVLEESFAKRGDIDKCVDPGSGGSSRP